jgi:hypothetical protein
VPPATDPAPCVIAVAGRRIDPAMEATPPCFPYANVPAVHAAFRSALARERPALVIASAACGADLIALSAAAAAGIRFRVVLPFAAAMFRASSVVDRPDPAYWGPLFDRIIAGARSHGDLVVLGLSPDDPQVYARTNAAILAQASETGSRLDPAARCLALIAWDRAARAGADETKGMAELALSKGFEVREISTLDPQAGDAPYRGVGGTEQDR